MKPTLKSSTKKTAKPIKKEKPIKALEPDVKLKSIASPTPKTAIKRTRSKSKHYIDAARFKELIIEYYRTNEFTEELGEMINKLSEHLTYMPRFLNYSYHDSMISDSNYRIVKALNERKYDPERGNPFSYFTKVGIRSFFHVTEKERKNNITVDNYRTEMYDELLLSGFASGATDNENYND